MRKKTKLLLMHLLIEIRNMNISLKGVGSKEQMIKIGIREKMQTKE